MTTTRANLDLILKSLDCQIFEQNAKMEDLLRKQKSIEQLLTKRTELMQEITELQDRSSSRLDQLLRLDEQLELEIKAVARPKLSARRGVDTDSGHEENTVEDQSLVEIITFDEIIAHYDKVSAEVATRIPVTREGYVGVPADFSR